MHIHLRPVVVLPYDPLRDACHDIQDGAQDLMRYAPCSTTVEEAWRALSAARTVLAEVERAVEACNRRHEDLLRAQ